MKMPERAKDSALAEVPGSANPWDGDEGLLQECIEVIRQTQRASVSVLQRRLRIGYVRAANIMDELERRKIVGPAKPMGEPRDILNLQNG
jgi:S-DNA-T family DNA segregation ATPase FtsK/SpoIIIE